MGWGGGVFELGNLEGRGAQAVLEIQVDVGVKKNVHSVVGVWIVSGITHSSEGGTIYLRITCKMEFVKRSLASLRRRYAAFLFYL